MANAKKSVPKTKGNSLSSNKVVAAGVPPKKFQMPAARKQMGGGKKGCK